MTVFDPTSSIINDLALLNFRTLPTWARIAIIVLGIIWWALKIRTEYYKGSKEREKTLFQKDKREWGLQKRPSTYMATPNLDSKEPEFDKEPKPIDENEEGCLKSISCLQIQKWILKIEMTYFSMKQVGAMVS